VITLTVKDALKIQEAQIAFYCGYLNTEEAVIFKTEIQRRNRQLGPFATGHKVERGGKLERLYHFFKGKTIEDYKAYLQGLD
jgi:hypothetical protein